MVIEAACLLFAQMDLCIDVSTCIKTHTQCQGNRGKYRQYRQTEKSSKQLHSPQHHRESSNMLAAYVSANHEYVKTSCFGLKHLLIMLELETTYEASVCDEFEMRLEIPLSYKPDLEIFRRLFFSSFLLWP